VHKNRAKRQSGHPRHHVPRLVTSGAGRDLGRAGNEGAGRSIFPCPADRRAAMGYTTTSYNPPRVLLAFYLGFYLGTK
jgi:hypothetical protein